MTTSNEIVQYAINLANAGMGVDKDGMYGTQCADLPCFIVKNWFGVDLWGNAIDLLNSASQNGLTVIYDAPGVNPKAGDLFVMSVPTHEFGHTGVVITDSDGYTIQTIEQNIDGNWDALTIGGPARFNQRDFTGVIGWIRLPYDDGLTPTVRIEPTHNGMDLFPENGVFTVGASAINVRRAPNLDGEIVAVYQPGESVVYDSKGSANGYRWISYVGDSGKRNYMAIGQTDENGNRISLWGELA